ncbi:M23 family metallopeptidase, partial [Yersinia pestis]
GGIHIKHTDHTGVPEQVRAIADGTVFSVRQPSLQKRDLLPLNYNGPTDCGYVLIKHETEIGSDEGGKVAYWSLYMHMKSIGSTVSPGSVVYRKDPLGTVGMVDGQNAIHFQIFCDDANIKKLTGRETPELDLANNGRTDVVYGDIHFYLPAGTPVYDSMPKDNTPVSLMANGPVPRTKSDLFVTMRFHQGSCTMTTLHKAVFSSMYLEVGEPLTDADGADYEYNLYSKALTLYPNSPSAGYELLRFGRVINTDNETLSPAGAPLWRTINYPEGKGVVNLAAASVKVFSDADFPHWMGWQLVDDDTDTNSQCNSPTITLRCKTGVDLSGMICHFPLEWDKTTVDNRFQWLAKENDVLPEPMELCDLGPLTDHAKALCLAENPLPSGRVWHFEPTRFIEHFRKCGWLSNKEMKQLIPTKALSNGQWQTIPDRYGDTSVLARHYSRINKVLRKYLINTPFRMACFFGNAIQETAWLTTTHEGYVYTERNQRTRAIIRHYNIWYYPWYGRGFLQLTSPGNYYKYFKYRGYTYDETVKIKLENEYNRLYRNGSIRYSENHLDDTSNPELSAEILNWRNSLETGDYEPADSAGFYWCTTQMAKYADPEHILERQVSANHIYYRSPSFWQASATVNLPGARQRTNYSGLNGFIERCYVYGSALAVLTELKFPDSQGTYSLEKPEENNLRRTL